jgi:hypothetical protein
MMTGTTLSYETSKKKNVLFITFGLLLILTNSLLMQQNRQLKEAISEGVRSLELARGTYLPPLDGLDPEGRPVTLGYEAEARKTLLLVFSAGCRACKQNMPNWRLIRERLGLALRVAAVSLWPEGAKQYVATHGLDDLTVVVDPEAGDKVSYKLAHTPQTILVGPGGRVEGVWTGLLDADAVEQIVSAATARAD